MGGPGNGGPGHSRFSSVLTLTKSRSAWLGLLGALVLLAWRARRLSPTRWLVAAGVAGLAVLGRRRCRRIKDAACSIARC